jgi:hypothetical protein
MMAHWLDAIFSLVNAFALSRPFREHRIAEAIVATFRTERQVGDERQRNEQR